MESGKSRGDNKKESKRNKCECTEEILSQAIEVLQEPNPDELYIFGQYVAMELRGIQCEKIRRSFLILSCG